MMNGENTLEKIGLLILAGACIAALTTIAIVALWGGPRLDPNFATMVGAVVTGLISIATNIFTAVRAYATGAQLGKMSDQLAKSGPVEPAPTDPEVVQQVEVVNPSENPVPTTDETTNHG